MKILKYILNNIENMIMLITLPLMLIFVFTAIIVRYFGIGSMSWSDEASRFLMIWLSLAGASYLFKDNNHLGLSFFVNLLPLKFQQYLFYFRSLIIILFQLFITYYSITILVSQISNTQTSPNLGLPMWVVYSSLLFYGIFGAIRTIQMTYKHSKEKNYNTDDSEEAVSV